MEKDQGTHRSAALLAKRSPRHHGLVRRSVVKSRSRRANAAGEHLLHVEVEHMPEEVLAVSPLLGRHVGLVHRLPERHLVSRAVWPGGSTDGRLLPLGRKLTC